MNNFYNPPAEERQAKMNDLREDYKRFMKKLKEWVTDIASVAKALRKMSNDPLQKESTWEKLARVTDYDGLYNLLKRIIEHKVLNDRDEIDWNLQTTIRSSKLALRWYREASRIRKKTQIVRYGRASELDYLVFGSEEGLDVKDDPILNAFMVGFQFTRGLFSQTIKGGIQGNVAKDETNLIPHKDLDDWLRAKGIKLNPKRLNDKELLEELKEVTKRAISGLTPKQREVLISTLIGGKSYQKVANELGVNKKTVYERLYGDKRGGGAIRKLRRSSELRQLAKKLGFLGSLPPQKKGLSS